MDINFFMLDVIHDLSTNFSLYFESFLEGACKSRSELNMPGKYLKNLLVSLLSIPNV